MKPVYFFVFIEKKHVTILPDLQNGCHKHGTAHQGKDHEAREALLSDAQEFGLLPWSRAL